jgi:hypothetical protein
MLLENENTSLIYECSSSTCSSQLAPVSLSLSNFRGNKRSFHVHVFVLENFSQHELQVQHAFIIRNRELTNAEAAFKTSFGVLSYKLRTLLRSFRPKLAGRDLLPWSIFLPIYLDSFANPDPFDETILESVPASSYKPASINHNATEQH